MMDYIFKKVLGKKNEKSISSIKRSGMLDFQHRILELADSDIPITAQVEYIGIVINNLKTFCIERIPEVTSNKEMNEISNKINHLFIKISFMMIERNMEHKISIEDDKEPKIELLYVSMLQSCYTEETDKEKLTEQDITCDKLNRPYIGLIDRKETIITYKGITPICWIVVPRIILTFSSYKEEYNKKYPKANTNTTSIANITFLGKDNVVLRCPYDNYITVLHFIEDMCNRKDVTTIWITLYRVNPKDSRIVKALKKAAMMGKKVFVFIEVRARNDEENNCKVYSELSKAGCFVKTDYFGYKVHAKMFLAMDKDSKLYAHIGTGNYNEITAKQYTDTHIITTDKKKTEEMLNLFIAIFEKNIYVANKNQDEIFAAPTNLRIKIQSLIEEEIQKKKKGRIYIKVNNFCDKEIANMLYKAARYGVDVKVICRSACILKSYKSLQVRSKAGKYLEHDRLYVFGDKAYISSADLQFRNISKRFEILCKVDTHKILDYFMSVWNSNQIFRINKDYSWDLI